MASCLAANAAAAAAAAATTSAVHTCAYVCNAESKCSDFKAPI